MIAQAEGLKFGIEHLSAENRIARATIVWQFKLLAGAELER